MRNRTEPRTRSLDVAEQAAIQAVRQLRVPHPEAARVLDELRRSLELAKGDQHLTCLVGPTGVGKTWSLRSLENGFAAEAEHDPSPDRRGSICTTVEAHSGRYRPAQLDRLLLIAAEEPLVDRKMILPGAPGKRVISFRGTNEGRRQALLNVLNRRRPSMLCFDEAQHLSYLSGRGMQQALDDLKTLADECSVPLLFVGTYELATFSSLSGQLARRTREVHFSRYTGAAEDWLKFNSTLNFVASKVCLDFDPLEEQTAQYIFAGCIGCVGLLMDWFVRSLERALRHGRNAIARLDLEAEAWPAGKLERQLTEAQSGESTMRELQGDFDLLRTKLGLSKLRDRRGARHRSPGRRTPVRDEVGFPPSNASSA